MSRHTFSHNNEFSEDVISRMVSTDEFMNDCVLHQESYLQSALEANQAAGLDNIDVAPNQGKLFYLLAKLVNAKNILEVGTLGGYSAIWLAKSLPADGRLITLEIDDKHAEIAKANIKKAGFEDRVEVRIGPALETLKVMEAEGWGLGKEKGVFDMVFIDADKPNNWEYLQYALKFARVGTAIIVDNVGRKGKLADENFTEGPRGQDVLHTRRMFKNLGQDSRLEVSALQTVGCKGWDGFALAVVVDL